MNKLSQYSDEELLTIAKGGQSASISDMTDDELMQIAGVGTPKVDTTQIPPQPNLFEGETLQPDITAVNQSYDKSKELLSYLPGEQVPEKPAMDFFKPGLLPKGTTEKLDELITGISPRTFGNYPVPEGLSAQEKGYRTLHNLGAQGAKFGTGFISSILENPIGTIEMLAEFAPEVAQKVGKALGVDLSKAIIHPEIKGGVPLENQIGDYLKQTLLTKGYKPEPRVTPESFNVTETEQKASQREIMEQPLDVVLALSPLLKLLKGKTKNVVIEPQRSEVQSASRIPENEAGVYPTGIKREGSGGKGRKDLELPTQEQPGGEGRTQVQETVVPEAIAEKFDIIYNGLQERPKGKPPVHLFTDKKTGTTFAVENLIDTESKLLEKREAYQKSTLPSEAVTPSKIDVNAEAMKRGSIKPPPPEGKVKEPWEMTKEDFYSNAKYFHGSNKYINEFSLNKPSKTTLGGLAPYGVSFGNIKTATRYAKDFHPLSPVVNAAEIRGGRVAELSAIEFEKLQSLIGVIDRNRLVNKTLSESQDIDLELLLKNKFGIDYKPNQYKTTHPIQSIKDAGYNILSKAAGRGGAEAEIFVLDPSLITTHKQIITKALSEGKTPYSGWEKDYSDLAAKYSKSIIPSTEIVSGAKISEQKNVLKKRIDILKKGTNVPKEGKEPPKLEVEKRDLKAGKEPPTTLSDNVVEKMRTIAKDTYDIIQSTRKKLALRTGEKVALEAMTEHDVQIRGAEFTSKKLEKFVDNVVKDKDRQLLMVHAYEHKMQGEYWNQLTNAEKEIVQFLAKEKTKLNDFIKSNQVLEMMPESEFINHIFHHWINPKTGEPYKGMYGKFSKGLPQAKQRMIPDYKTGIEAGMQPATTNLGKLIGLEWEAAMRAHQARGLVKVLHNIGADPKVSIQLTKQGKPRPVRMIESWDKLNNQYITEDYVRYDNYFLDKPITFHDATGELVRMKGAVGVRKEIYPFVKAYIESPSYSKLEKINFATKSLKLGFSLFHVVSLGMQEAINRRIPFKNIPRGLALRKNLSPELEVLYKQGLDIFKGYEDTGYRNKFFEGENKWGKLGNAVTKPIELMRSFIFDVVQPGMKISFAYDKYMKLLPKYLKEGKTKEECARDVVRAADGHFSGEHYKRSLLETNRFMTKAYFDPTARRIWQVALLSPTWQREHILVAKDVVKSFIPNSVIRKFKLGREMGPIRHEYQKYALGAICMVGAVDLYNLMMTKEMDGEAKHIWQNPPGKGFSVRAWWDEPTYHTTDKNGKKRTIQGGHAYFRPLKSIYEVAEWWNDPVVKMQYKFSPIINTIGRQFWPSRYDKEYKGIKDVPERVLDVTLDLATPIQWEQVATYVQGKKSGWGVTLPFFGMPTSKEKKSTTTGSLVEKYKKRLK